MPCPRFYCPDAVLEAGLRVRLTDQARHHAGRVLRLVAGDAVTLFDGRGRRATGPIEFSGADAWITAAETGETPRNPVRITLLQALVSPEKMDWIIEKGVETGISGFAVAPAERSVTRLSGERLERRLRHWKDVAASACEQCGSDWMPDIRFFGSLERALAECRGDHAWILSPAAAGPMELSGIREAAFAVGPEGGFSPAELESARALGWRDARIGPRVLRTETAGLAAAVMAGTLSGDLLG